MQSLPKVKFHLELILVIDPCGGAGNNLNHVTIETLPDNTLLEIFDFYRMDAAAADQSGGLPWMWHRLAHVCQRWRYLVYTSPRCLDLQILCKSGAPIEPILCTWPTLPLVLRFQGDARSEFLPDNIMIALRYPDRVCDINLTLMSSIIGSISELLQVPFLALKRIEMSSKGAEEQPVLGDFLGGSAPLLEQINLQGIAVPFPAIRRLLLSTSHLNTLQLFKIPNTCYFSPEDLVTCLSALVHLKDLDVGFHSPASRPNPSMARPPPPHCATLLSLVTLFFLGASEYLEEFLARIDCPVLTVLGIVYFKKLIFKIPRLLQFISRVDGLNSPSEVVVNPDATDPTICLLQSGPDRRWRCYFLIPWSQLDLQLSFSTQILRQLSPLLSSVHVLCIAGPSSLTGNEDMDPTQWLELFQLFPQTSTILIDDQELVPDIVRALVSEDIMATGILPGLTSLHLKGYRKSKLTIEAAERWVSTRKLAGRNILLSG